MENKYRRLEIIALVILILGLYALTVQTTLARTGPPIKSLQVSQIELMGTVTDANGMPLPGATIAVKGENRGTITDLDGNYELKVTPRDTLIFSHMGFETVEEPVNGRAEINIRLEEDISALQSVEINAGYYSTTRRESTGNISRVTAEEIEMQPVVSPLLALQGRMAGVEIIPGGSHPGMATTIRIRGRNSLRDDGNLPLYIINGVPVNSAPIDSNSLLGNPGSGIDPLNFLNLYNIASIEVLKDADATAIYGSRGANGVVLITTKKGRYGKAGLEAMVYTGAATVPNRLELLNTEQYLQIRRKAFENDGIEPTVINAYDLLIWDQNRYTDWQDFFFGGTSPITDVNLATSGGSETTTFRLSGSYHEQGTVYSGDLNYNKLTGSLSLNHIPKNKKWAMHLAVNYGLNNNNSAGNINLSSYAFQLPPNAPSVFDEDGNLNWAEWTEVGLDNPYKGFYNTSKTHSNNLVSNMGFSYHFTKDLIFKSNFGYTNFSSSEILKRPRRSYNPANWENIDHSSSHLEIDRRSWIAEPQLVYSKPIGKGQFDALFGATFQESKYAKMGIQGEGYVSEPLIGNLSAAERIVNGSSQNTSYRYSAVFGRLAFNWDKKYFINLTGRRDGSSRFGPGKKFANFGAIGGSWIFTEEPLFKSRDSFLSFGKLRASYGTTGNDQIGDYGYLDAYEATPGPGGLYPTQLFNPDYSWEINKKLEAGTALGLLDDRLNFRLSW